jgi:hypothetical protein
MISLKMTGQDQKTELKKTNIDFTSQYKKNAIISYAGAGLFMTGFFMHDWYSQMTITDVTEIKKEPLLNQDNISTGLMWIGAGTIVYGFLNYLSISHKYKKQKIAFISNEYGIGLAYKF